MLGSFRAVGTGPRIFREDLRRGVASARSMLELVGPVRRVQSFPLQELTGEELLSLFSASLRDRLSFWTVLSPGNQAVRRPREPDRFSMLSGEKDVAAAAPKEFEHQNGVSPPGNISADTKVQPHWQAFPIESARVASMNFGGLASLQHNAEFAPGTKDLQAGLERSDLGVVLPRQISEQRVSRLEMALKHYFASRALAPMPEGTAKSALPTPRETSTGFDRGSFTGVSLPGGTTPAWELRNPEAASRTFVVDRDAASVSVAADVAPGESPPGRTGFDWQLRPAHSSTPSSCSAVRHEDLPDLIAAMLHEQSLAHGIDLT